MTLGIAADHAGFEYKERLKQDLAKQGYEFTDYGTDSTESVDYPDYAHPLAAAMVYGDHELGIALCGSGNGISMTLNKYDEIRAALCWNIETAKLARLHNDANICSIPARFVDYTTVKEIVLAFLTTKFEGGRHQRRVDKITASVADTYKDLHTRLLIDAHGGGEPIQLFKDALVKEHTET